jgi:hypothetical protein
MPVELTLKYDCPPVKYCKVLGKQVNPGLNDTSSPPIVSGKFGKLTRKLLLQYNFINEDGSNGKLEIWFFEQFNERSLKGN